MPEIAVLGSANMDLVVHAPNRPEPGETVFGNALTTGPGGKGLNQAIACSRAGAPVSFLGAVGADDFGGRLRATLTAEGVDATLLETVDRATGAALITVSQDAENTIVVVPGANTHSDLSARDRARIRSAGFLVLQLERPVPLVHEALLLARSAGTTTVLTPAPVREEARELMGLADILVPNEGEAIALSGESDSERAAAVLSRRAETVIVTLGAAGCLLARDGAVLARFPAVPVAPVDTTGAGDVFVGCLVAQLSTGHAWADAITFATAGAALAVTRPGAAASAPFADEVRGFLDSPDAPGASARRR